MPSVPSPPLPSQKSTQTCCFTSGCQEGPASYLETLTPQQPAEEISDQLPAQVNQKLLKCIFQHGWNDSTQQGTGQLKTRIGIDFNEPHFEIFINHIV